MVHAVANLGRLIKAGITMARHDVLPPPEMVEDAPGPVRALLRLAGRIGARAKHGVEKRSERLSAALMALGPSYIKFGQFLATRPDIVGGSLAEDLLLLQDKLPPFDLAEARATIEKELGAPVDALFSRFDPPVAAASIAQVHRARTRADADGEHHDVAIKVLRPGIEQRFHRDLETFFWVARTAERLNEPVQRLRPVEVVQTLADSVALEMDLRLEAAAMSEMRENTVNDEGFRVPEVFWPLTAQRVLTLEWIDGTPASDVESLIAAGHDMKALGTRVIQTFLLHALRDGFFHADMHQGNLFVEEDGTLVAVDFGIMGRMDVATRRYLAEILFGFIVRDYRRVAEVHFEAGYVPATKRVEDFAQALRSIGEPIMGRSADEISMARLLTQLFQVTDQFDMKTQPQLLLLQKTMVVVEGVARNLDPEHNIWVSAEPVLRQWIGEFVGPEAALQDAAEGAVALGRVMRDLPDFLQRAERTTRLISQNVDERGVRLHPDATEAIASAEARRTRSGRIALWIGAAALAALAIGQFL